MADHAPESPNRTERMLRWFTETPDAQLSLYMLLVACLIGFTAYALNTAVF